VKNLILIVDDNLVIRNLIRDRLSRALSVDHFREASGGHEAIELASKCKPDLVILDVSMPDMDGVAVAKHMKQSMPKTPIILFTIYKLDDSAAKLGVNAVVSKLHLRKLTDECAQLLL